MAFVPQNNEGIKVYRMLEVAFKHKLLFTVATTSTGEERVTFSDIPLKTKESGGHDRWELCEIRCLVIMQLVAFLLEVLFPLYFLCQLQLSRPGVPENSDKDPEIERDQMRRKVERWTIFQHNIWTILHRKVTFFILCKYGGIQSQSTDTCSFSCFMTE